MGKHKNWSKLDNAAKIFPPASSSRDTKVFRLVCELYEPVEPDILQTALERTIAEFPLFRCVLKKGLFWYYFEESGILPQVQPETQPVCSPLYNADKPGLLFRVLYHQHRINLEAFHALSDGTGVMHFLRTLVFYYLAEKHGISDQLTDYDAAQDQKNQDAFYQYYDKDDKPPKVRHQRAHHVRGHRLPGEQIGITEGFMPVSAVLDLARAQHVTLSELLVANLIASIGEGMALRERSRPVVVTVPVNLRRFFPARTARNFFGVIRISHHFRKDGAEFSDILKGVREGFRSQLHEDNLRGIITRYSAIENHLAVKSVPLPIKIPVLRGAAYRARREDTTAFSNIGQISMPEEAMGHIRLFSMFLSTWRPQLCLCSFGDTLTVSVSSPFSDTGVQRNFFRRLSSWGIPVRVVSNLEQMKGEEL